MPALSNGTCALLASKYQHRCSRHRNSLSKQAKIRPVKLAEKSSH